ncbi:hypothetical protein L6164_022457 [Bauhinia variegata]|uniref:Uncharacterized protein n=1 Tax=Bauhinia variegata TaxID=167791 RepID=A0ACB9MGJ8_BAUVA|nr:hypothetical protein L6164_022457 [Bauhinia variegata]
MAQLLFPVYTEAFKVQNPSLNLFSRNQWRILAKTSSPWTFSTHGGKRRGCVRARVATENSTSADDIADDYYAVLGLVILKTLILLCLNFTQKKICLVKMNGI